MAYEENREKRLLNRLIHRSRTQFIIGNGGRACGGRVGYTRGGIVAVMKRIGICVLLIWLGLAEGVLNGLTDGREVGLLVGLGVLVTLRVGVLVGVLVTVAVAFAICVGVLVGEETAVVMLGSGLTVPFMIFVVVSTASSSNIIPTPGA